MPLSAIQRFALRAGQVDLFPALLVLVFLASRILVYHHGVRIHLFEGYQWQLLDPALLETRLLESLLNLHSQPPLFNALYGCTLKIAATPQQLIVAWTALHLLVGAVLLSSLYATLRLLNVSRAFAALLSGLFICSPAAIAYENFLSYTYIDAALISGAVYLLVRAVKLQSARSMGLFFALLAILCLTRAAYHVIWLIAVSVVLALQARRNPRLLRAVLLGSVVAIGLVGAWYVKNLGLFGVAGASSWAGMNLATMTHTNLPQEVRQQLVTSGAVTDLTLTQPFQPLDAYPASFLSRDKTRIPALDETQRSDDSPNFNHRDYIGISAQFGREAVTVIKAAPQEYLTSVARNLATFVFRSSADYVLVAENVRRIDRWDALYSVMVYGQLGSLARLWSNGLPDDTKPAGLMHVGLKAEEACLFVAIMVIVIPGLALWKLRSRELVDEKLILWFALITFAYVLLTTNLLNFGETQRMRFEIEPLLVVLLGWFARDAWQRLAPRSRTMRAHHAAEANASNAVAPA